MMAEQGKQDVFQGQMETATLVTGRLAHDFGNILTGILGFAELSLTQLPADSPARHYVEEIVHNAQNGAGWIRKLQAFSRRTKPGNHSVHLGPLVSKEEDRLREAWGNRVTFLVALPADLPAVALDGDSVLQLLGQVLDNAGEAVAKRGVVTLSARTVEVGEAACQNLVGNPVPGRHVEITITDSGTGLSAETRQRLFRDLFFSTKARRRGLGLALVHGILHAFHAGMCFGPDPEQGTTVRLFLPLAAGNQGGNAPALPFPASDRRGQVLVVDDDPMVLRLACDVLANAGFQVQGAAGPQEAIDLYQAEPFRLIVSDILMPGMNGFEMVRQLQRHDSAVNVLFISSQSGGLANDALLDQFPLLKKPFRAQELVEAVIAAVTRAPAPCGGQPQTLVFNI
jgi:CheY-like chemotaxis protein